MVCLVQSNLIWDIICESLYDMGPVTLTSVDKEVCASYFDYYFTTNLSQVSFWQIISTVGWLKEGSLLKEKISLRVIFVTIQFYW